ncbi:hypothetical protein M514_20497 [Trichuris suis]|uniref:ATP synthase F(0) complex subunit e, mitochondrial n=1 Tax=Trichuris suis TaxID=68888 RepID=A0A085NCQ2_9BILA|nr:hypothetical protein M514_20497 [Trichuris suis]
MENKRLFNQRASLMSVMFSSKFVGSKRLVLIDAESEKICKACFSSLNLSILILTVAWIGLNVWSGATWFIGKMPIVPEHPNRVILKPPINVSPTIRAARYIFLTLGVAYGVYRQRHLEVMHQKFVREVGEAHLLDRLEKAKKAAVSGKESLAEVGKELGFGRTVEWAGYKYEPIDLKKSL